MMIVWAVSVCVMIEAALGATAAASCYGRREWDES